MSLFIILTVLTIAPACRSRKPAVVPPAAVAEVPTVSVPSPSSDFPRSDSSSPRAESLEELNRRARENGWIRDAFFPFDSSVMGSEAQRALQTSASWLRQNEQYGVLIEGHCDERGTEQYNLALGDRRAHSAVTYLQALGISSSRIRTISYGEERPFDTGHDESAWAQNRRAHIVITTLNP